LRNFVLVLVLVLVLDNGIFEKGSSVILGTNGGDFGNKKTGRVAPSGFCFYELLPRL
jgi:hypothetical protein